MKMLVSFILCMFIFKEASSQSKTLLNVDADSMQFKYFVTLVESKTNYHFYYDDKMDSLYITVHAHEETIENILKLILTQPDTYFSIDNNNNIYITPSFSIQTSLLLNKPANKTEEEDTAASIILTGAVKQKNIIRSSLENKIFTIGSRATLSQKTTATISGYIKDSKSSEPITGASIRNTEGGGAVTDQNGYYSLTVPKGNYSLKISSIGMTETHRLINVYSDGSLNINMDEFVPTLKDVFVTADNTQNIKSNVMGAQQISIKTIKQIPTVFGEADVLRAVLTLPGVTSVGESSTGFNVRGGAANQNLILFNDATIYNPSHFFGFFSAFNPDVIKNVELYKSSIPEKYGGRLSSVLNVTAKEGNKNQYHGTAGLGPLTSKIELEGPIDSGKTSFLIGARTTYSNWLLRSIHSKEYFNSNANFSDGNLLISHEINAKNNLYLNAYASSDKFRLNGDTLYSYSNRNANIKWKHIYNSKLSGILLAGIDHYQFAVSSNANITSAYKFNFAIDQINARVDFNYALNTKHNIDFGLTSVYYKLQPGNLSADKDSSLIVPTKVQTEKGIESALYAGDNYNITSNFSVDAGVRLSVYNYLGAQTVYSYLPNSPRQLSNISDSTAYSNGSIIKTYILPEVRVSARYQLTTNSSVKISYNSLSQYINSLSNTTAISPTDVYKLSDRYVKPQLSEQYSIGYYHNFKSNTIETSVKGYYKSIQHYLDYKGGASLILNQHIETEVLNTKGYAYGVEFLLRKTVGKLNGWVSYTYSKILLKTDDAFEAPVNKGSYYPADYDKPNSVNFIGNFKVNHRFNLSLNVIYGTGRPITLPIAKFYYGNSFRVFYSDRNEYKIPDYFRSDISMNLDGNYKLHQLFHNSWTFGVYNITARKNAYSVYYTSQNGSVKGYKLSVFGTAIPFITLNINF